jgi:hypothetical protein
MAHVYNPSRLLVLNPCVTVAGTVDMVRLEADGDDHVLLHLDAGQLCAGESCLDGENSKELGDLVVEPICEHAVTQADAVAACSGYQNPLAVPGPGTHVTVTGPWVLDQDHGWQEIHPAESFGGSAPAPPPPATILPQPGGFSVSITASRYGYVAATTIKGATCTAQAVLPSGRTSTAQGLQQSQTAGANGAVSWTYRTVSTTKPGRGTHMVTCSLAGMSETARASFTVG